MRGLLVLGCIAFGVFLVTASPHHKAQSEVEAKHEGAQEEFVHTWEIRSTGNNRNRGIPSGWPRGVYTALAKLPTTRHKRNSEQKRKKCPGCYSPLYDLEKDEKVLAKVSRQQRDADEHENLKRKHKHLKEKSHTKRRKHKHHEDRHAHFQAEDAEIGHSNQKRRKHHRGKKDRDQHRHGSLAAISSVLPNSENINMDTNGRERPHRRWKDRSRHRTGSLTALGLAPSDTKKMEIDNHDRQDMTKGTESFDSPSSSS